MPLAFKDAGDTTMVALLNVSQYHRESRISEADIEAHLRTHPRIRRVRVLDHAEG